MGGLRGGSGPVGQGGADRPYTPVQAKVFVHSGPQGHIRGAQDRVQMSGFRVQNTCFECEIGVFECEIGVLGC